MTTATGKTNLFTVITVKKEGVILNKGTLEFENEGVLNPAVLQQGSTVHMYYRAVRTGNHSTVGYARLEGPLKVVQRDEEPLMVPESPDEEQGIEDARTVMIDGVCYMTYTAYDGWNVLGSLAVSTDLRNFERKGPIVPLMSYERFWELIENNKKLNPKYRRFRALVPIHPHPSNKESYVWDKNVILFPRKINGQFVFMHRIRPGIQLVRVNDFTDLTPDFWEDYIQNLHEHVLMESKYEHEISYIGGGCPPIETEEGWVIIYHGVHDSVIGFVYTACAALLDLDDPQKELARLPEPLFAPEYDWELQGYVNNVCFPTGTALFDDTLYIYYGAADEQIACASLSLSALVEELVKHKQ
jgi:beta-1,2-mannobiose phosphorylase / 1,2-beta-oligomannan phosphorylase